MREKPRSEPAGADPKLLGTGVAFAEAPGCYPFRIVSRVGKPEGWRLWQMRAGL